MNGILSMSLLLLLLTSAYAQVNPSEKPDEFLPKSFVVVEELRGDLTKDHLEDVVYIIQGTDEKLFVEDESRGTLNHNPRGIVIRIQKKGTYELALENYTCFPSDNEDGGVYYAPDLSFKIAKGNLYVIFDHGRYGSSKYTFRYQHSDFELIGYDQSDNFGPVVAREISINFMTRKKLERENTFENKEGEDEIFKETWKTIKVDRLIKLSEIKDFRELDLERF
ncbi:MAG: hypothetical protein ACXIUD_14010 [Mongoliitalea sp.]